MLTKKLDKQVILYRNQFEKMCFDIFKDHRMDRYSLDLDAILFRIKYMTKRNKDLDKLNYYKEEFTKTASEMRDCFANFLAVLLTRVVNVNDPEEIEDVFAQNVNIDASYVKFDMIVISSNVEILKYIDDFIPEDNPLNIYPNEYFRFSTDSYNDGIAKAYPELFEDKHQTKIGTGDDADVFVHSLTIQSSERCSLSCSYCISGDSKVHMWNGLHKQIKDIKEGDIVVGFSENAKPKKKEYPTEYEEKRANRSKPPKKKRETFKPAKVTKVFKRTSDTVLIKSPYLSKDLRITLNHKVLTSRGWIPVEYLKNDDQLAFRVNGEIKFISSFLLYKDHYEVDVYNIETTTGTYVANGLCVHNCYQFNKSEMRMSFDTAKTFIDNLLTDKYTYINRYNSPALILEFIGGEPFLEIKLTRKVYEYFLDKCYELNHPWFTLHRLSICSNGMQYFDAEVQSFFKDYASQISFNISIDGNKELHDACRVQPNGEGSYDIDMCALNHFNRHYTPERNSKMTLSPSNISYLYDSVVDFIKNGMTVININCVFEEGWNRETARIEYEQLKKLARYLLDNNLEHLYIAIFNDNQEDRALKENDSNSCGSTGSMLAVRPNGQFYPCLRFMPTSVGHNVPDLCMGSVQTGMVGREEESEILQMLDSITRRSQTNDICYECPIGNNCANCSGLSHTLYGTPNKRTTFICVMHIAEHLANVYYWNWMILKHPEWNIPVRRLVVPDEWALEVIDEEELENLKLLEAYAMYKKIERQMGDGNQEA